MRHYDKERSFQYKKGDLMCSQLKMLGHELKAGYTDIRFAICWNFIESIVLLGNLKACFIQHIIVDQNMNIFLILCLF